MPSFEFQPPKEQLKVELQKIYQKILSTSVSPENVQTFFDTTLNELVVLIEKAVTEYKKTQSVIPLVDAEVENRALQAMNIPDVTETLQAVSEREQTMTQLRNLIVSQTEMRDTVILPPQEGKGGIISGSGAGVERKKLIPRLLTLLYILENDLGYTLSQEGEETSIRITEGTTTDEMMRQHPYYRVLIESLNRVVYLCEEEGNASYILDTEVLAVPIEQLDVRNKNAFNDLIKETPEAGRRLIQSPLWRKKMVAYLTEEFFAEVNSKDEGEKQTTVNIPQSDFVPRVEVPRKKAGWESASGLRGKISSDYYKSIMAFVEQFRVEHPEWFEKQKARGKEAEHYHPDLVQKIMEHFTSVPQKKEGWESAGSFHNRKIADFYVIKTFAEQFRVEHPEWFEKQKTNSKEAEHYHPELVEKIMEHFTSILQKKEGWESASSLWNRTSSGKKPMAILVDEFRVEHPEWFEKQKASGKEAEHYHPELVEKIMEHFTSIPQKKEGWESANGLRDKISSDYKPIAIFVEQFRVAHPEWFEKQKNRNMEAEHYHPELVEKIMEHFTSIPQKKEGWESARSLQGKISSSHISIKKFVEQFRVANPEWFEKQKTRSKEAEHYHPDLVQKIKEHFPPKGE
ncbi:MAG: hypothetical protein PHD99_04985 [Candidatus Moranbacteria bacterium]|nr:hypothetical protein [Candidatus Moranbacteria bacterium]